MGGLEHCFHNAQGAERLVDGERRGVSRSVGYFPKFQIHRAARLEFSWFEPGRAGRLEGWIPVVQQLGRGKSSGNNLFAKNILIDPKGVFMR
jgi:hypothetical protein